MKRRRLLVAAGAAVVVLGAGASAAPAATPASKLGVSEFRLTESRMSELRERWLQRLQARYDKGDWAPMRMELTDDDLKLMGLPPKKVLLSRRYSKPTTFDSKGRARTLPLSALKAPKSSRQGPKRPPSDSGSSSSTAVATFAGTGFLGIRPGAWLLLLSGGGIGWCSMAHVYGSPGSYDISTAGHCGKTGDIATVIGVVGNRNPVLLDFGKFGTSHDGGLGNDWALIDIESQFQHLVTPTMAFWGGPRGMFTKTGDLASVSVPRRGLPTVNVNPDPFLAQQIVHYGHGLGMGPGGTPRSGTAIAWRSTHYMFFGAISPGDSGSGANTLLGDSVGANMEAAGIMTHLYIDPLMRQGLGIMGGTRATAVSGTLANGQIVPYPAPVPGAP